MTYAVKLKTQTLIEEYKKLTSGLNHWKLHPAERAMVISAERVLASNGVDPLTLQVK
ncbi:hypothetical protein G6L86_18700 [Agrobacterium tumefaciens]|uniref:hypothetical protein n=1 Tax=Agrobacterium tumefaciens TaxID=358 RepID=UPI0015725055|nr:hypothetical protein [Agrobacterium tumefaciens]NSX87637.1 hypothetical protein [Agrobacterium tumefaciens]